MNAEKSGTGANEAPLSAEQIKLIQSTWELLVPIKEKTATLFYQKLFLAKPEFRPLFKGDIESQGAKLVSAIATVVNALDKLEQVVPTLQSLGQRHVGYGVKPEYYDAVGGVLLQTFEQCLGDAFTAEAKTAWTAAYGVVASTMIAGATS